NLAPALPICHVAAAAPAGASLRGLWTQTHPPTPLHPTNSIPQPRRHCLVSPLLLPWSLKTDEEFDACWAIYFNKPNINIWELYKGMNVLVDSDLVPEPQITDAALQACRQRNDLLDKAGPHRQIYPYIIQELRPTLNQLGNSTPEDLGLIKV
uniref:Cytochrome c oxidase subunit 5A, mitochondrial n=1 Tax=Felis catus TaxID=9685 RepID=A0ABI7Y3U0_FELCA